MHLHIIQYNALMSINPPRKRPTRSHNENLLLIVDENLVADFILFAVIISKVYLSSVICPQWTHLSRNELFARSR
jgi:hypothetical protein